MAKKRKQKHIVSIEQPFYDDTYGNMYSLGSFINGAADKFNGLTEKGPLGKGTAAGGLATAVSSAAGQLLSSGIGGGRTSTAGNIIGGARKILGNIPGPIGMYANIIGGALEGGVNLVAGAKLNQENIQEVQNNINQLNSFQANASSFDELGNLSSTAPSVRAFDRKFIGKNGLLNHSATNKYNSLKEQVGEGTLFVDNSIKNNAENLIQNQATNLLSSKYATGGTLGTHGADFSNGYIYIDNGGTHEENPNGGVQVGVDSNGIPNLVEEGEYILNGELVKDYVVSNRLLMPDTFKKKYKLGGNLNTFADGFKHLTKESDERPNDPISQNGLNALMMDIQKTQEEVRAKKQQEDMKRAVANMSPEEQQMLMAQMQGNTLTESAPMNMPQHYAIGGKIVNKFKEAGRMERPSKFSPSKFLDYQDLSDVPSVSNTPVSLLDTSDIDKARELFGVTYPDDPTGDRIARMSEENLIRRSNNRLLPTWQRNVSWLAPLTAEIYNQIKGPDYTVPNRLENEARRLAQYDRVSYTPEGTMLTYRPMDINLAINDINAQAGSTMRTLNNSGLSRALGAHVIAADNNRLHSVGAARLQNKQYNDSQREKVATFNRGTRQFNNEASMKAQMANQNARETANKLSESAYLTAMQYRDGIDRQRTASTSANITNVANSFGAIGKENAMANIINTNPYFYYGVNPFRGEYYYKGKSGNVSKDGGYLTIKRKKGKKNG